MELIFYKRGKGRITKSLSVYSDGEKLKFHYLTFDRTNPTKKERESGEREKRIKTLDIEFIFDGFANVDFSKLPHQNLTSEFLDSLKIKYE